MSPNVFKNNLGAFLVSWCFVGEKNFYRDNDFIIFQHLCFFIPLFSMTTKLFIKMAIWKSPHPHRLTRFYPNEKGARLSPFFYLKIYFA